MTQNDPRFDNRNGKPVGLDWTRLGYADNPKKPIVFGDTKSISPQVSTS